MRTLYLRNVDDETSAGLQKLAELEGMSVNAFVVRELAEIARRARNFALLDSIEPIDVTVDEILSALDEVRGERDDRR